MPSACARADRIVLPGVGAYADCRAGLDAVAGMVGGARGGRDRAGGRPFLGICVGMQLMSERGLEKTMTSGLRLDRRRRRGDHAHRPGAEDPADRLEHDSRETARTRCSTASRRARRAARLFRPFLPSRRRRSAPTCWRVSRLWRPGDGRRSARDNSGRHAVPSREEPGARPGALIANFLRWKPWQADLMR